MFRATGIAMMFATSLLLGSCAPSVENFSCDLSSENHSSPQSEPLEVAIHVDGSGSMLGYVKADNSRYIQTLNLLDETLSLGGLRPKTSIKYYRSGTSQPLSRGEFRNAQQPVFYDGSNPSQFSDVSVPIDEAITSLGKENTLLVMVTDLDQAQGDVTKLNRVIQAAYLNSEKKGYAVGVWAVKSEFNGTVYVQEQGKIKTFPFPNPQSQETLRPFYIMFIGLDRDIERYFDQLRTKKADWLQDSQFVIFSPHRIVKNLSSLDKKVDGTPNALNPQEWSLKNNQVKVQAQESNNQLWEISKNKNEEITINDRVDFVPLNSILAIDPKTIDVVKNIKVFDQFSKQFKKTDEFMKDDSSLKGAMELSEWTITDDRTLSFVNQIKPDKFPEPGIYLFTLDIVAKGLQEQPWWDEWSWREGKDNELDGSKTRNLSNFLSGLKTSTTNLMEENPPVIGRFCYGIQKN
jgi:hypothetical protein